MILLKRFAFAFVFALLLAGVTYVLVRAGAETAPAAQKEQTLECFMCHPKFNDALQAGAHGHATSDPRFAQMWEDQGKPGACLVCHVTGYDPGTGTWQKDGVACEACHGPVPSGHAMDPQANPVPVDRSAQLCGTCHSDARFGWAEWQTSTHFQRAMTCTVCHDPHSAALKTVTGAEDQGPSALCINCHREVSMDFPYSKHNQAGVSCVDCHLRHFEQQGSQDVHAMPDHSFQASLATCNTCHSDQMHTQPSASTETPAPAQAASLIPALGETAQKPAPVSPAGFAGLAGLLGLAGGMVLSPWMDKMYRRFNNPRRRK